MSQWWKAKQSASGHDVAWSVELADETKGETKPKKQSRDPESPANTLTYNQRKHLRMRERNQPEGANYQSETLDPCFVSELRAEQEKGVPPARREVAHAEWMEKLKRGVYSRPRLDRSRYLALRNTEVKGNPRQTEE